VAAFRGAVTYLLLFPGDHAAVYRGSSTQAPSPANGNPPDGPPTAAPALRRVPVTG